jgi:hypothetical protein
MPANAAPLPAPAATFTPRPRPVSPTGPIHVPYGRHLAPAAERPPRGPQAEPRPAPRRHVPAARDLYERVLAGVAAIPVPDERAAAFTADARRRGGLPLFRAVGKDLGWAGLDSVRLASWPAARLARESLSGTFAQTEAARSEIWHAFSDADRREKRLRAAADAAPALGYPGGSL